MNCPVCATELKVAYRDNIELDVCPQCRGVWLDRGELDKIIEQEAAELENAFRKGEYSGYAHKPNRKRKGFLGEFFDFD